MVPSSSLNASTGCMLVEFIIGKHRKRLHPLNCQSFLHGRPAVILIITPHVFCMVAGQMDSLTSNNWIWTPHYHSNCPLLHLSQHLTLRGRSSPLKVGTPACHIVICTIACCHSNHATSDVSVNIELAWLIKFMHIKWYNINLILHYKINN